MVYLLPYVRRIEVNQPISCPAIGKHTSGKVGTTIRSVNEHADGG